MVEALMEAWSGTEKIVPIQSSHPIGHNKDNEGA